jgi:hypothetical protein
MTSRLRIVLFLAALLLVPASLALASGLPAASPAPVVAAAPLQPLDTVFSTAAQVCPRADLPALPTAAAGVPPFLSPAQPLQTGGCGLCSAASCVGKFPNASCGAAGFRCIETGFCGATAQRLCKCLII